MKSRAPILLGLALLLGAAMVTSRRSADRLGRSGGGGACCPSPAVPEAGQGAGAADSKAADPTAEQAIAYYFHGTVRCETCLLIENLSRAVIEQEFGSELAMQRLRFVPVNYDLPENAHFLADYKLPCPSLVLVRQATGQDVEWKLLGETWQRVHEPFQLDQYVETEVRNFLTGQQPSTDANPVGRAPAPDRP